MIKLDAIELTKRSGFAEAADRLSEVLEAAGYDPRTSRPLQAIGEFGDEYLFSTVLASVIDRYLGPAVAPAELYRRAGVGGSPTGVSHGAMEDGALSAFLAGISVEVDEDDVLDIARDLARDFHVLYPPKF